MTQPSIFQTLEELRHRSTAAVIGQSGLNHLGLAAEIRRRFDAPDPLQGGLMQQAILEAAPGYVEAEETLGDLSGGLLDEATVAALDGANDSNPNRYRFRREWKPYAHQIEAWRELSGKDPRSVLVTSGTGSGKTECFLVPILDDLVRQSNGSGLEGVQAVVLYPLNALIASQEERLKDWTAPFKGKVRFCLYNGVLPDERPAHELRMRPEAVGDRKTLRSSPPPVLVTNVTMLEYMLLRKEDVPILTKSQGKLRYVVLDEAHSYVGARAAEIALLLRRVCLAFGVSPAEVRFIATSATIGGSGANEQLRKFLADVAGVGLEQVTVIEGRPKWPTLPATGETGPILQAVEDPGSPSAYKTLSQNSGVRPLLDLLRQGPVPWSSAEVVAKRMEVSAEALALAIASAQQDGEALSPLRVHAFHRAIPGVWSCLNPGCSRPIPANWPFGSISTEDVEQCVCGTPTFDVVLCNACGEPFVDVLEQGDGSLVRAARALVADEYALEADNADSAGPDGEDEGEAEDVTGSTGFGIRHRLVARPLTFASPLHVDVAASRVFDSGGDGRTTYHRVSGDNCKSCEACHSSREKGPDLIRPFRFGAPFILQNATPLLLESAASAVSGKEARALPIGGRQVLSFTDSRQGTARFSAKLQVGSERNFVRSFIYHSAQYAVRQQPDTAELDAEIAQLRGALSAAPGLQVLVAEKEAKREELISGSNSGLEWQTLVSKLSKRSEVKHWLKVLWARRDVRFENPEALANFLLLREFFRRPRRAISVETLGLARLSFASVDSIPEARVPSEFRRFGGSAKDWRDYLDIVLTYAVRENAAVNVGWGDRHWIQPRIFSAEYVKRPDDKTETWHKLWPFVPQGNRPLGRPTRPVLLLAQGLGIPLDDVEARAGVQECLDEAWSQLSATMPAPGAVGRQLEFSKARIVPVTDAFVCPITRRILDTTFRGLTPYGAESITAPPRHATKIVLPNHPYPFLGAGEDADQETARELVSDWLIHDPVIADLRDQGVWSDISDRVALFADYFRSAEHSAQQSPKRLRGYEAEFKRGEINVLNCSTTMEMGVDIGSVSHVMMTNVPPSLASYRQRIGRAGRRRQAASLGFTFCRNQPLDRAAFANPVAFLKRNVAAPKVALDSAVIVQRHVNALLFAAFVKGQVGNALKMQAGPFFGCPSGAGAKEEADNPAIQLANFSQLPSTRTEFASHIAKLLRGSVLENDPEVFDRAATELREIRQGFFNEWEALQAVRATGGPDDSAMNRGLSIQLKRMCDDYLLSVLSSRGFLPGHGFPTGVVSFVCQGDFPKDPKEEQSRFNSYPQRQLDVAIREYAPGSEIVLDGLVHRSAGVTLNWRRPASVDGVREIQNLLWRWRCRGCGESGTRRNKDALECPSCFSANLQWWEYLEPAGFAADLSSDPHADPDIVSHVSPEPPAVTIQGVEWSSLIEPSLGRLRASRRGQVFYCNAGPDRQGYKLCLHCGRAEPGKQAVAGDVDGERGWTHKPLLAKADADGDCPGSSKPFSVKPSLRLGYEISTDVFELQIAGVQDEGTGLTIAIALRESLASRLGIEPDEMGFAVEPRAGALGHRFSLFLFDKSSGGAGFSVQAQELMAEVLSGAAALLDCRVTGCVHGCPACVLVGGLSDAEAQTLNRKGALDIVRRLSDVTAPQAEDRADPNARLVSSLFDVLERASRAGAHTLRLRIEGPVDLGELSNWGAAEMVRRWSGAKRTIVLSLPTDEMSALDGAARLALRDRLHEWGATLQVSSGVTLQNGARVIAEAEGDKGVLTIATRDPAALIAGPRWGRIATAPLVSFECGKAHLLGEAVGIDRLQPSPGAVFHMIDGDLDGDLARFGKNAADLLRSLLIKIGVSSDQKVVELSYSDRYLRSPLVARLALETFKALAQSAPGEPIPITLHLQETIATERSMRVLWDDWKRGADRLEVLKLYGRRLGMAVTIVEGKPKHGRVLTIRYADGSGATILFDQGFGAWDAQGVRVTHDFMAPPAQQVNALSAANVALKGRPGGTYVVAQSGFV